MSLLLFISLHPGQKPPPPVGKPVFLQTTAGFVGNGQYKQLIIKQFLQALLEVPCAAAIAGNFHEFPACLVIARTGGQDILLPLKKINLGFVLGLLGLVGIRDSHLFKIGD